MKRRSFFKSAAGLLGLAAAADHVADVGKLIPVESDSFLWRTYSTTIRVGLTPEQAQRLADAISENDKYISHELERVFW